MFTRFLSPSAIHVITVVSRVPEHQDVESLYRTCRDSLVTHRRPNAQHSLSQWPQITHLVKQHAHSYRMSILGSLSAGVSPFSACVTPVNINAGLDLLWRHSCACFSIANLPDMPTMYSGVLHSKLHLLATRVRFLLSTWSRSLDLVQQTTQPPLRVVHNWKPHLLLMVSSTNH